MERFPDKDKSFIPFLHRAQGLIVWLTQHAHIFLSLCIVPNLLALSAFFLPATVAGVVGAREAWPTSICNTFRSISE